VSEVEQAIMNEREACAELLEGLAQERRKWAAYASKRERREFFLETADLVSRLAQTIRERESIAV